MNIVIIGTGYVGLVTGTCLAELGHNICCVDKIAEKITMLERGDVPIYEPGLQELIASNVKADRLSFSTELKAPLQTADIVFIAVGTPTNPTNGEADLRYVFAAAEEIAKNIIKPLTVVIKSTVPVGTGEKVATILAKHSPEHLCDIVSNPEFLREGSAVKDFLEPDRIVIGTPSEKAENAMQTLYKPLTDKNVPLVCMNKPASAELAKYACNAYLAMRISFVNEISDLCEKLDATVSDVTAAMGMDKRIGSHFLKPGPGFGGSCFPKDTLALRQTADSAEAPSAMVKAAIASNEARKKRMAQKITDVMDTNVKGKTIAILGLTFKANTDDMRDSPSLVIVPELLKRGAILRLYDPEGMEEAKKVFTGETFENITWCPDAYNAVKGSDTTAILTEWPLFKNMDFKKIHTMVSNPIIVDLRAILPEKEVQHAGFKYHTIGKRS